MATMPAIGICGLGRLGANLALELARAGHAPVVLRSRDAGRAAALASMIGPTTPAARTDAALLEHAVLIFLTVADDRIADVARGLAASDGDLSGKLFVHCSGAHGSSLLAPLKEAGAFTACFHPLQSFAPLTPAAHAKAEATIETLDSRYNPFRDISVAVSGADRACALLETLARALGAKPSRIGDDDESKALYHAGAVIASNGLVTLLAVAVELLTRAGYSGEDARRALLPLVKGTFANLERFPAGQALTGPVARGDAATLELHRHALSKLGPCRKDAESEKGEIRGLYLALTKATIRLAESAGRIDAATAARLRAALEEERGEHSA